MPDLKPVRDEHGVPVCTEDQCPQFDGKRCRAIGFRPDRICEPAVRALAARVAEQDRLIADLTNSCAAQGQIDREHDAQVDRLEARVAVLGTVADGLRAIRNGRATQQGSWLLKRGLPVPRRPWMYEEAILDALLAEVDPPRGATS